MMSEIRGISRETVRKILLEDTRKRKVCVKFVPQKLIEEEKQHEQQQQLN